MKTSNNVQASLRIVGKVQMVGFRDAVRDAAISLNLIGYVENNKDGSVSVLCEGSKAGVEKLISAIKKLSQKDSLIAIDNIETVSTKKASGRFKSFEIKRGNKDDESGIRMDTGIFLMKAQYGEMTKLHGEMRATRQDIREGNAELGDRIVDTIKEGNTELGNKIDKVGTNVNSMADRMDVNFGQMRDKYHVIGEGMVDVLKELKESRNEMKALIEEQKQARTDFAKILQTFIDMQKKQ